MIIGITVHEIIVNECIAQGIDYEEMLQDNPEITWKILHAMVS